MTVSTATVPGQILTSAYVNNNINSGLTYIASSTIGNAVSTHTVSGCFSSTYDNYKVVITGGVSAANTEYTLQLGGITTSVYSTAGYFISFGTATLNAFAPAAATSWYGGIMSSAGYSASFDIISPNLAKAKFFIGNDGISSTGFYQFRGYCSSTAAATGFTLASSSSTMTGGTVTVYGYRKV